MTGNEQEILNRLIECERRLMQLLDEIRILDERFGWPSRPTGSRPGGSPDVALPYEVLARLLRVEEGIAGARAGVRDRQALLADLTGRQRVQGAGLGGGKFAPPPAVPDHSCGAYALPLRDWSYTRYLADLTTVDFTVTMTYSFINSGGADYHVWRNPCITFADSGGVYSMQVSAPHLACTTPRIAANLGGACPVAYAAVGSGALPSGYTAKPFRLVFTAGRNVFT